MPKKRVNEGSHGGLSGVERQRRFVEVHEAAGLRRVRVWVPEGRVDELRSFAGKLCEQHAAEKRPSPATRSTPAVKPSELERGGRHG